MSATERRYLSIGEVLGLLQEEFPDVTISKIRFLESQGLIDPERTPSGYRKFYPGDIERLRFILHEQKEHFLPLKVIRDRLEEALPETNPVGSAPSPADPSDLPAEPTPVDPMGDDPGEEPAAPTPEPPAPAEAHAGAEPAVAAPAPTAGERLPVWMTHRPKNRNPLLTGGVEGSGASYTAAELAEASGLSTVELAQAVQFGLVSGRTQGKETFFGPDALSVAKVISGFLRTGIEPRHLRTFKTSADREVGLYEQVILPLLKQRNPQARAQAVERLNALSELGGELRAALLRQGVRQYLD